MTSRPAQTVESGFSRIQSPDTDEELAALSTRTVALGATGSGRIEHVPLEVYVARVLSGEGEPNAPEATQRALAVAIRTYTVFNTRRHAREGFDLCDAVHCQVPRAAARDSARNAALATAGTGDVLAGAIAGLIAQGVAPFDAAGLGVYLHGAAAETFRDEYGHSGLLASELGMAIARVAHRLALER